MGLSQWRMANGEWRMANEPGLGSSRTYQPGEMPMPSKPKPGLTRMHQEMNSEAASSGSPLRAAVPPKRAKVEQKVQTNQTMQDLVEIKDELERTKRELDEMTKTKLSTEEDRDIWKRLFEDCSKKQSEEIERLRRDYKERMALTTAVEKRMALTTAGSKPAATATEDITSDTGRQLGQSTLEFEDLLGHHGDGLRRRDDSPVI